MVKKPHSLVECAQGECKGNPCYEERNLGRECFSQWVRVVTKHVWAVLNGSLAKAAASTLQFPWQPKHSGCYSTSSLALPSTRHWGKDLRGISCLGKPAFLQWVWDWVKPLVYKAVHLKNPNLPQILGQSCHMLVSRCRSRFCLLAQRLHGRRGQG